MKNFALITTTLVLTCGSALAQPTQINQASVQAAASGVARATTGFPFRITQPGSYQLTSNLVVPANTSGIEIQADNVILDLNGFTISGPVTCFVHVGCTGSVNDPIGILGFGSNPTVRNGSVVGFNIGIFLPGPSVDSDISLSGGLVEEIHVSNNSAIGISIESGVVRRNTANLNGSGIAMGSSLVTENVANFNLAFGLVANVGGLYGSNTFLGNGSAQQVQNNGSVSQNNNACNAAGC